MKTDASSSKLMVAVTISKVTDIIQSEYQTSVELLTALEESSDKLIDLREKVTDKDLRRNITRMLNCVDREYFRIKREINKATRVSIWKVSAELIKLNKELKQLGGKLI